MSEPHPQARVRQRADSNPESDRWTSRRTQPPRKLPLHEIAPNPLNPRSPDDEDLAELADTMRSIGQLQPILIVSRATYLQAHPDQEAELSASSWVAIGGNRRLKAMQIAGIGEAAVQLSPYIDSKDKITQAILIENGQRQNLAPLEEAVTLQEIQTSEARSIRDVARLIGKSHTYVKQRLDLLKLIPEFQELLRRDAITIKQARTLGTRPVNVQRTILTSGPPYRLPTERHAVNPVAADHDQQDALDLALKTLRDAVDELSRAADTSLADEHVRTARTQVLSATVILERLVEN